MSPCAFEARRRCRIRIRDGLEVITTCRARKNDSLALLPSRSNQVEVEGEGVFSIERVNSKWSNRHLLKS